MFWAMAMNWRTGRLGFDCNQAALIGLELLAPITGRQTVFLMAIPLANWMPASVNPLPSCTFTSTVAWLA